MPTTYLSGGKLGDFIQQLSVVYEKYLLDQKPVILYIGERGDTFRHGVLRAYQDLLPIVSQQPYIQEFKVYHDEPYEIDLTTWRNHIDNNNYVESMKKTYQIEWGRHPWLFNIPKDPKWKDMIVINTTHYRFPDEIDWLSAFQKPNVIFAGFDANEHQYFVEHTKHNPVFYQVSSLWELCVILNSCGLFIGSLSAPLSVAFGLHTPLQIGLFGKKENHPDYRAFYNIQQYFPPI